MRYTEHLAPRYRLHLQDLIFGAHGNTGSPHLPLQSKGHEMTSSDSLVMLVIAIRVGLDLYSGTRKRSSVWTDLSYILFFLVLGMIGVTSDDSASIHLGWVGIVLALGWCLYAWFRKDGLLAKCGGRKSDQSPKG